MCSVKLRHFMVVALCMLSALFCQAQESAIGDWVSYVSFAVPGAIGTYPMSINSSMAVAGYYYASSTITAGFLREADGTITTFSVRGSVWSEPVSLNDAGEITGFYEDAAEAPHSFIRYPDGQIVTFDPPCLAPGPCNYSVPVSINSFGEIAGNFPFLASGSSSGFRRSRAGVFNIVRAGVGADYGTTATAINASGAVVGFFDDGGDTGFLAHPDGFWAQFSVPLDEDQRRCLSNTVPESINAEGVIAGWFEKSISPCNTKIIGGFVLAPGGDFTTFQLPGTLVTSPLVSIPRYGGSMIISHRISLDQAGDIAGSYTDTAGSQHGFVRNPYGTITSFDPPRGRQTTASSINDSGVIAGSYFWNSPVAQGFLRIPKP